MSLHRSLFARRAMVFRFPSNLPLVVSTWELVAAHRVRGQSRWTVLARGMDHDLVHGRIEHWVASRPKRERGQWFVGEFPPGLSDSDIDREVARVSIVDGRIVYRQEDA